MISQTLCASFKAQVLLGVHDFRASGGDTFKIALYTSLADLGASTTQYTATGECVGAGYSAGGITLTNLGVSTDTSASVGFTTFANATFTGVTLTARGALIYNTTPSATAANGAALTNPAVCVLDFGEDKTVTASNLTVVFPANTSSAAIIRIA
jgi:hypothetical protein